MQPDTSNFKFLGVQVKALICMEYVRKVRRASPSQLVGYVLYAGLVCRVKPEKGSPEMSLDRTVGQRRGELLLQRLFENLQSHDVLYL